jgi:hypothetical protein
MAPEDGIMYLTAGEHLGQYMPHELAHAQLPLRHPALRLALTMARHIQTDTNVRTGTL